MSRLNWWRRSNFEGALQDKSFWEGKTALPFRLDIGEAKIHWNLPLNSKVKSLKKFLWWSVADFKIKPDAKVTGELNVKNNGLDLMLQSLLKFHGIWVDGPLDFNFWPKEIRTGDFGVLHLLMDTTQDYYVYFQATSGAYVAKRLPLGHDSYNSAVLAVYGTDYQPPPRLPPLDIDAKPKKPYRLDFILNPFIVDKFATQPLGGRSILPNLFDHGNRLPRHYDLEVLFGKILTWLQVPKDPKAAPSSLNLSALNQYLKTGASITLDLKDIRDLFVPGILDLGPSSGKLLVSLGEEGMILGELSDLDLNLDPMDYPAQPGPERPPFHLKKLSIRSGSPRLSSLTETFSPGVKLSFDPQYNLLTTQGNLDLDLEIEVPLLGTLKIQGNMLFKFQVSLTKDGPQLLGGKNFLQLNGIKIFGENPEEPLLRDFRLVLTDRNEYRDPILDRLNGLYPAMDHSPFTLEGSGVLPGDRRLDFSSEWSVPLLSSAYLDFHQLFPVKEIPVDLRIQDKQGRGTHTQLRLRNESETGSSNQIWDLAINAQAVGTQALPNFPQIKNGHLRLKWLQGKQGTQDLKLSGTATQFQLGNLDLRGVETQVQLADIRQKNGVHFKVPTFRISANPQGSTRGKILGRLLIEQKNTQNKNLEISWNPEKREVELKGLILRIHTYGLNILSKKVRKVLDPSVRYLGFDGWLRGHFSMHFPENIKKWKGKGALTLWGDRDGDLYWQDGRGRRVGPPLLRNTRWDIYRIDGMSPKNSMAWGIFKFDTTLNPTALLKSEMWKNTPGQSNEPAFGARGQKLRPYETNLVHSYSYQLWSPEAFVQRNLLYLEKLCQKDPTCANQ